MRDLEARMRRGEWFHPLAAPPGMWTVVRVDGRAFTGLTESLGSDKPFDERFASAMWETAAFLLKEFNGLYAYTESDEISLLLPREWDLFGREVEKLVSLTAASASVAFARHVGPDLCPTFDSRVWLGATDDDVLDYFAWRMADAFRCGLNGWAYWTLRKEGASAKLASKALLGTSVSQKNELLHERGININDVPAWQRRGAGLWWEPYAKVGRNPITNEDESAERRRIHVETELPQQSGSYRRLVRTLMAEGDLPPERAALLARESTSDG